MIGRLFALLVACGPSQPSIPLTDGGADADDSGRADIEILDTGGRADDSATPEPEPEERWPQACADLYDPDILQEYALEFSASEWTNVQSDCANGAQTYRPVTFTANGETVEAMARLKGNWSWSCDKPQFVVSFNEVDPEGRFHGLRKLMLDAPWYDRTILHERLAFPYFAKLGLPYSCANSARLVVNSAYLGLYTNVERIDHEYLERHFEEPEGNLYQGGAELKTNEDIGDTSNLAALRSAGTADAIGAFMNLDQALNEWAAEAMLPALDNYWAGVEINYYLYDHPSQGFLFLPYDLDISFGDSAYTSGDLVWPDALHADPLTYEHTGWRKEDLMKVVLADPVWCGRFVDALVVARADFSPEEMTDQIDAFYAQIAASVAADTRKPFTTADHNAAVQSLKAFLVDRAAFVDDWLAEGDHCPASG